MKYALIPLILVAIVGLVVWAASRRQKPPEVAGGQQESEKGIFVIGQQMAAAQKKEEERLKSGTTLPSPLPEGNYVFVSGELGLIDPKPADYDRALRRACDEFRRLPSAQRDKYRNSVSKDEFYKLLAFARRSAVFALRDRSMEVIEDGLTSLAMIESDRVDFRDILDAVSLLYHVAGRVGGDADAVTTKAAELATPEVASLLVGFTKRSDASKDLKNSWGYVEVGEGSSVGFARWDFERYQPTLDLYATARDLATCIDQDDYYAVSIELGSDVPAVWLRTGSDDLAERLLKSATGAVTISTRLKPEKRGDWAAQQFSVFLAELDEPSSAAKLAELSRSQSPTSFCRVGVAEDRLFCLIVTRSWVEGVAPYEKGNSVERFRVKVAEILSKHARTNR